MVQSLIGLQIIICSILLQIWKPQELTPSDLNKPKYYGDVCLNQPDSYSNYHTYTIEYGDASKYIFGNRLGEQGGYGEVLFATNNITKEIVVIKVLKTNKTELINREIMILKHL
jgi:serine/threonine protein kinase